MAQVSRLITRTTQQIRSSSKPAQSSILSNNNGHLSLQRHLSSKARLSGLRTRVNEVTARSHISGWDQRLDSTPIATRFPSEQLRRFSLSPRQFADAEDKGKPRPRPENESAKTPDEESSTLKSPQPVLEKLKSLTPPVLHENIYTLPNFLTTTRVITAPIISWALLHSQPVLAFGLFAYSSVTDLVDGWLARRYNTGTVLGSILDPFADKLLMTLTTISLWSIGTFPWWLALTILGRDAGLLLSALYFRWISLPPPKTMVRYWDFSLPSAEVRPTEISKINTLLQFLLVADAVLLPVLPVSLVEAWNLWGIFEGWMALVAGTTIWSGMSYFFAKDAIRFIGQDQKKNK